MKKSLLLFSILMALFSGLNAQTTSTESKIKSFRMSTHSGYGFSWADLERKGNKLDNTVRFTVVINLGLDAQWQGEKCGLSVGLETRNLGLIYDDTLNGPNQTFRVKSRVYTLGVPVTFMFGKMSEKTYFFAGGEIEYTFDYKEKVFVDGDKEYKSKGYYDENVTKWLPSLHAGIQIK